MVDDQEASRFIVRELLKNTGYHLFEAESAGAGLERIANLAPDLVLLDLNLAGIDGVEVYERIRRDPASASLPVIVVTSDALSAEQRQRLGATPVLVKESLSRALLQSTIDDALAASAGARVSR